MSLPHNKLGRRGRRALATGAVVAAAALVLAGCSGFAGSTLSASGKTTTLSFFSWDTQQTMKPEITAFEKENPNIKISFSYAPPVPTYISTLQTRLLAGTAADVFILTAENKVELVQNHDVKNLDNEPFAKDIASFNKSEYTLDGHLYGISTASWGGGIMYNADLLSKVGFTTPPTSWAQFLQLCAKLKAAGITPFYEPADGIGVVLSAFLGMQNQADGGQMDKDIFNGTSSFEKEWTPSVQQWGQLFSKGLESRTVAGLTGTQVTNEFIKGNVAMIGTGSFDLATVKAGAPSMNIGFFAVPGATAGQTFWAGAASPAYAINAKTKHLAAAEKFLAFLAGKSGSQIYNKTTASITTTSTFQPVLDPSLKSMVAPVRGGQIYLPSESWTRDNDALSAYLTSVLQQYIQGKISAQDVGKMMDAKLKALG